MSDLRARLRIEGDASSAVAAGQKLKNELTGVAQQAGVAGRALDSAGRQSGDLDRASAKAAGSVDRLDREMGQGAASAGRLAAGNNLAASSTDRLGRSATTARGAISLMGVAVAAVGGRALEREIKDAALAASGLELGMGAVAGGAREGGAEIAWAADQADRLGLVAQDATRGLLSLSAATRGTELQGQATRDIWLSVNEAGMALGRTNEQLGRGITAIEQIAGKGVVSMEEIRQQLAEAIPGAVAIAARAMNMTTGEFDKMVSKGDLLATDFLPRFAAQLREEYGPAIEAYMTTPMGMARVESGRLETHLRTLQATSGQAYMTGITSGLAKLNEELASPESLERAEALGKALADGVNLAADAAILLADNLDLVVGAAQAVAGVALVRWLTATAVEARGAAAAYILKGQAARIAAADATAAGVQEVAALNTVRGAIIAAAQAEVQAAAVQVAATETRVAAANAALAQARAEQANAASSLTRAQRLAAVAVAEAEVTAATNAHTAALVRQQAADAGLARSKTLLGQAAKGASTALKGMLAMVGGPWGAAFLAAGAAVWILTDSMRKQAEVERENAAWIAQKHAAMEAAREAATRARIETGDLTEAERDAAVKAAELTGEQKKLADAYWLVAAAAKAAALAQADKDIADARSALAISDRALDGAARRYSAAMGAKAALPGGTADWFVNRYADGLREAGDSNRNARSILAGAEAFRADLEDNTLETFRPDAGGGASGGGGGGGGKGKSDRDRAAEVLADLKLETQARIAHTAAVIDGEAALDAWAIADAGRQAVARAGVEATSAQGIAIREQAELVERLAQADDRIASAKTFERQAIRDTEAMQRRTVALAGGRQAMEALRVSEARLDVLVSRRIDNLERLSAPEREALQAAMDAAEAKERQAIATEKAEAAAGAVEDLDRRIAAEERRAAVVGRGTAAEVEYARAEYVRQAVEAAGLEITDEAAQAIMRKADALFRLTAATDAATEADNFERQLRLAAMSNRERQIALRTETLIKEILAQQHDLALGTARAQAESRARMEAWREDWATVNGEIADDMRQSFIESGDLAFDDMGEALKRQLRAAIYDALLAKPINMVINAVMSSAQNSLGSLLGGGGQGGGLAGLFGQGGMGGGLSSLFGQGGAMAGLGSMLPVIGQAAMIAAMSSQLSGGIAGALGGNSKKASQWGVLGLVPGLIAGLTDKADRPYARADVEVRNGQFVFGGAQAADGGDKEGISAAGKALADQLNALAKTFGLDLSKLEGFYTTIGKTEGGNAKALGGDGFFGGMINGVGSLAGQKDIKGLTLGRGVGFSQGQDAEEITEQIIRDTILRAINAGASDLSEAERRFVAAAESLDEAVAYIEKSRGFSQAIEDSILSFTDPAAYEKKKALEAIEASYQALKTEATTMIEAGLISADVMARLDELKRLQIEDALKKLASSAEDAGSALARVQPGMREWLDRQMLGAHAPLNPLEQRNEAFRQYEDVLARALGGDADALSNLTEYADRLLSADRAATSDASARALLFEEVMADIRALTTASTTDPVAAAIEALGETLSTDPVVAAIEKLPGALVLPALGGGSGADLLDGLVRLGDQLTASQAEAARRQSSATAASGADTADRLEGVGGLLAALLSEIRAQNAFQRQALARITP